jgi:hypothetical protein
MPPHLLPAFRVFSEQAERVQAARVAVFSCLPVGRVDPAPVPVGLDLLHDELVALRPELGSWRIDEVDRHWRDCAASVDEALDAIPAARKVALTTDELEELLGAVADVLEPLGDAWEAAERHWLGLRRR